MMGLEKMRELENRILLRIPKKDINFLNRIIEGYDNLGVVSTLDPQEGLVMVRVTPDTRQEVMKILAEMPFAIEYLTGQTGD